MTSLLGLLKIHLHTAADLTLEVTAAQELSAPQTCALSRAHATNWVYNVAKMTALQIKLFLLQSGRFRIKK